MANRIEIVLAEVVAILLTEIVERLDNSGGVAKLRKAATCVA